MSLFSGKKKNWIIVTHSWHVSSHGFTHEILLDASTKEANAYALVVAKERKGFSMPKVEGYAIELPSHIVEVTKNGGKE